MPPPRPADPVKRLAALLWSDAQSLEAVLSRLGSIWGAIDHSGANFPFDLTDYYEREMGKGLRKRIVSFSRLMSPEALADAKLAAIDVEDLFSGPSGRRVNIDPGYMDVHKVVLASVKLAAQKIHIGRGVCADMLLRYSRGKFHAFEWTFADFKDGRYEADLLAIRTLYKAQLPLHSDGWTP